MVKNNAVATGAVLVVAVGITVLHFTNDRSKCEPMSLMNFFRDDDFRKVSIVEKLIMVLNELARELVEALYKAILDFLRRKAISIF